MSRTSLLFRPLAAAIIAAAIVAEEAPAQPTAPGESVRERIRVRLESHVSGPDSPNGLAVGGGRLYASAALPAFYEGRTYRPAWIGYD